MAQSHRRAFLVLGPLLVLLVLWIWFFYAEGAFKGGPDGKSFEADYAMFVAAAQVMHDGGNAYDHVQVYRAEHAMLNRLHLPITPKKGIVRVGNPPLFFWALQPISGRAFQPTAVAWGIFLYALSAAGFLTLLWHLGWRRRALPCLIFMLMPQTILGPFYGNGVVLIFAGFAAAIALARSRPYLSGALLALAWLKPPIALPIVLLVLLFHAPSRVRSVVGFVAATLGGLVATIVLTGGHSVTQWIEGLTRYSHDIALSPDIASLAGLYVRSTNGNLRLAVQLCSILVALALTIAVWARSRKSESSPILAVGWLWVLWFLATPYAHFSDEILLTLPILAFLGRDGFAVTRRNQAVTLYLLFFSLIVIQSAPAGIQLLALPLVVVDLCLLVASREVRSAPAIQLEAA